MRRLVASINPRRAALVVVTLRLFRWRIRGGQFLDVKNKIILFLKIVGVVGVPVDVLLNKRLVNGELRVHD